MGLRLSLVLLSVLLLGIVGCDGKTQEILAHPLIVASPAMVANEVVALVKGTAELPCDVTVTDPDDPVRLVLWYRIDSSTPIYSVDTRDAEFSAAEQWSGGDVLGQRATFRADRHPAVLLLTNVKPKDEGLYRCRVDFRLSQTRNALVNLTVVVPPKRPAIVTREGQITGSSRLSPLVAGQSLSLSCETSGGKPMARLVWLRDGQVIDDSYVSTFESTVRNDLWIPALDRRDVDATITCEASNSNLTQPLTTSVTIDLLLPVVSTQLIGADHPLSAGKEVTLSCIVQGSRPPPLVTWFLGDQTLAELQAIPSSLIVSGKNRVTPPVSTSFNEDRSVIRFTASIEDAGKKIGCRARNANITTLAAITSLADQQKEDARTLIVHARPVVRLSLGSNLQADAIKEGDDVYFDCRASALPPVTRLDWYHNDKKLLHNISAGVITTNQSLVLQRVNRHSAGRYRCVAINREGDTESEIFPLDVKYAPLCRAGQHRVYGVARHEEARIICELDANPLTSMHFRWLFNSSAGVIELPPSTWTTDGAGRSVARYLPQSDLDFGTLLCSASNVIGNQAVPCLYHVIPADKPDPVFNCSIRAAQPTTADSVQVACNEGFSGGLPQNFLLEIFSTTTVSSTTTATSAGADEPVNLQLHSNQTSMKPVFTLRGLNPDGHYVAHVTAVNAKGRSDPVPIRLATLRLPETQKNGISSGKSEVLLDPPRPEPSSSGQISPLVAIITGAATALFILTGVLTMALRIRCRRMRSGSSSCTETTAVVSNNGTLTSNQTAASSLAGSDTLLLIKSEQLRSIIDTPLLTAAAANDVDNPDLIPNYAEDELLQSAIMLQNGTGGGGGAPLAAMLTDLPPQRGFCTSTTMRQFNDVHYAAANAAVAAAGSTATLGRNKNRWRAGGPDDFVNRSFLHVVSATLPRPPRAPWNNNSGQQITIGSSSTAAVAAAVTPKKESSV